MLQEDDQRSEDAAVNLLIFLVRKGCDVGRTSYFAGECVID